MRLSLISLAVLASCAACAGPHSTGALWAQQYVDQEMRYFATPDARRREVTHAFELTLADEGVAVERQRLDVALATCPGRPQALTPSAGDARRDAARVQAQGDADRLRDIARLAVADWYVRRAAATGDARFCAQAHAARDGTLPPATQTDLLDRTSAATVSRAQSPAPSDPTTDEPLTTLSRYVLGATDTVQAPAPLPQYLAWVYGGFLATQDAPVDQETAAALVDAQAAAYTAWEPDALYAALRGARP